MDEVIFSGACEDEGHATKALSRNKSFKECHRPL
jgi:hypothetical protein